MTVNTEIILSVLILLTIYTSTAQECYYDGDDFCVTQEDILSADLLPGTFFLTDPFKNLKKKKTKNKEMLNGTYEEALNKMDFHRKRMNEYLCHGFMAEEIFRDMRSIRVKRRQDDSSMNSMPDFLGDNNVTVHDKLLSDEGSSKYKEWLQRTTTLDDVYRHYKNNAAKTMINRRVGPSPLDSIEEFDGEVTGYAVPAPLSHEKTEHYYEEEASPTGYHYSHHPPPPPPSHHYGSHSHHHPSHEEVLPIVHEEYHYHAPHEEEEEHYHKPPIHHEKKSDLSIKDFFEIALTALAFLAFGCFIIQLLMAMTYPTTPSIVTEATRFKRDSSPSSYRGTAELNELSHRVLQSIESIMVAESDSGRCLEWTLCRDNQFSTQVASSQKFWIPMWSLGMSWLSSRVLKKDAWPAMFRSLRASVLGMGGANCGAVYSGCDLLSERAKRRRRRKK